MKGILIKRGAEAELRKTTWLGKIALKKMRVPKAYRARELDNEIRAQRTRQEARALHAVKAWGIRTPFVFEARPKESLLVMEWIEGKTLKETLQDPKTPRAQKIKWCRELGHIMGLLHAHECVHGDLTTSNVLVRKNKRGMELVLIDFGLAFYSHKLEDLAVDVIGLKKTYNATHFDFPAGWNAVVKGYTRTFKNARKVLAHMNEVEGRVRYA
ncbi:MAG: Kae1-associated serine/threonine protein kinase [Candidatus Diapherotrites archaeon]|nr:Kae1-associated serine/threonine protein kinase [Candidatus Diapherotrites archaeon]